MQPQSQTHSFRRTRRFPLESGRQTKHHYHHHRYLRSLIKAIVCPGTRELEPLVANHPASHDCAGGILSDFPQRQGTMECVNQHAHQTRVSILSFWLAGHIFLVSMQGAPDRDADAAADLRGECVSSRLARSLIPVFYERQNYGDLACVPVWTVLGRA
jgi:hypothetical protein